MIRDGIHVVVAAGKLHIDVKKVTPARVPSAITVSASDINDYASQTANWGDGVDIFAPGIDIVSAGITSKTVR
jgi:cerevisin